MKLHHPRSFAAVAAVAVLVAAGCGGGSGSSSSSSSSESSPPGDIPDNQAYVAYSPPGAAFSVKVPEGWARTAKGGAVTFTDKLNSVTMESRHVGPAPTVASLKSTGKATTVTRKAGSAIKVTYLTDSAADPVTGKVHRNAVERYVFYKSGSEAVLTLSGPKGADNVDPWRIVTDSFRWTA
jgi:hypothetical protein